MDNIKFSVIIPVYNSEQHIEKCLDSIICQKCNLEIIIVDDGSTDNTLDICQKYSKKYNYIKVFSKNNQGPGAAREYGLKYATGDYISFIDSDDYIEKDCYLTLLKILLNSKADILEFGYKTIGIDSGKVINEYKLYDLEKNDNIVEYYLIGKKTTNFLCNKVIKKSLLNNVVFPHYYAGEDACVLVQLFYNANKYISVSNIFYNYVMTSGSLCRESFSMKKMDNIKSDKFIYNFLLDRNIRLDDIILCRICSHYALLYYSIFSSNYPYKENLLLECKQGFSKYFKKINFNKIKTVSYRRKILILLFRLNPILGLCMCKISGVRI